MEHETSMPLVTRAALISAVSLVLGLCFNYFFFGHVLGVAFPLFVVLTIAGLALISQVFRRKLKKPVLWLLLPLFFFAGMVAIRTSDLLTFLNLVACLSLLLLIADIALGGKLRSFFFSDYLRVFLLPFKFFAPMLKTLSDLISLRGIERGRKGVVQVVKGIALAIPILLVFLVLFSSADLVFQKYVLDLLHLNIPQQTVIRTVLIAVVTLIYIGAYACIFSRTREDAPVSLFDGVRRFGRIESSIVLGSVNLLFFIFILVQIRYLFGGASGLSALGITYAEYARHGFFELIAVAVIALLLLLATEHSIEKGASKHLLVFRVSSTALIAQVMAVMASASIRLSLYEEAYGFTTQRLYSHAFIFFLAAIFLALLYKIWVDHRDNLFAFGVFLCMIGFLVAMNILNPDAFIVRANSQRFLATQKVDVAYLSTLSSDAVPTMLYLFDHLPGMDHLEAGSDLSTLADKLDGPAFSSWQSWSHSRTKAKQLLDARRAELSAQAKLFLESQSSSQ